MTTLMQTLSYRDVDVALYEHQGRLWISGEDLGRMLGFAEPRKGVHKIWERHADEIGAHSTVVKMTTADGRLGTMRVYDETGAHLVAMFARTRRAREVRLWLAQLPERVRDLRERLEERARAIEATAARRGAAAALALLAQARACGADADRLAMLVFYRLAGLTQAEAGRLLGLSRWQVQGIERRLGAMGWRMPGVNALARQKRARERFEAMLTGEAALPACAEG